MFGAGESRPRQVFRNVRVPATGRAAHDTIGRPLPSSRIHSQIRLHHGHASVIPNILICADDVGIPGLRHFLYKSKSHIQFTMPSFGDPYRDKPKEQKRVFRLYQMVKTQMQQRARPLKLELFVGPSESIFAWVRFVPLMFLSAVEHKQV